MFSTWLATVPGALRKLLILAAGFHLFLSLVAFWIPETGDQNQFLYWAHQAYEQGIHRAYSADGYGYDWLPLYLYVSKLMGAFFELSGLNLVFSPFSRGLLFAIKLPMILFNLIIGCAIFHIGKVHGLELRRALWGCAVYLFNPGIALATDIYGFQDALHTLLLVMVCVSLHKRGMLWVPVWSCLAFLTKPQAAIFLVPIAFFYFKESGWRGFVHGILLGGGSVVLALSPFIIYGTVGQVWQMYLDVTHIHEWLTGYAHNIWWLVQPVPPFVNDRVALLGSFNGLTLGLIFLGIYVCFGLVVLQRHVSFQRLIGVCAFVGFSFFMVTTELHENHLFAFFAFGAIGSMWDQRLFRFFAILSVTFSVNLVTALLTLHNGMEILLGPVRLATANAAVNVLVLGVWTIFMIHGYISGKSENTQA